MATFPPDHFAKWKADGHQIATKSCTEDELMQFGDLTYVINGVEYTLPSHHWISRSIDENDPKGGQCSDIITELDVNQDGLEHMYILGDVFM